MRRTTLILSALVLGLPPLTALAQSVEIEKALVDQVQGTDGRHALGGGEDVHQVVALPGAGARLVGETGEEIHDGLALEGDADRSTEFFSALEGLGKGLAYAVKARVAGSAYLE